MLRFYWLCLKRAYPGAWSAGWISATIFGVIGASISVFAPFDSETMNLLIGIVPLAIFAVAMIAGPFRAAFLFYRDLELKAEKMTERLRDKEITQEHLAGLADHINEGGSIRDANVGYQRAQELFNTWVDRSRPDISERFGKFEADKIFNAFVERYEGVPEPRCRAKAYVAMMERLYEQERDKLARRIAYYEQHTNRPVPKNASPSTVEKADF